MANVVITPLANTAFSGSFVNQLNSNLSKLAEAVNNGVLWRATPSAGQTSMNTDLDINGYNLLNAKVDGADLINVKRTAYASVSIVKDAKAWADVAEQYAEDVQSVAAQVEAGSAGQVALATQQAQKALVQAKAAEVWAGRAASSVASVASIVTQTESNTAGLLALNRQVADNKTSSAASLSALSNTVNTNKLAADSTASNLSTLSATVSALSTAVTSNKSSADATASSLATLTTTVTSNKTSADATQTALTALSTRVTAEENKVNSVAQGGTGATTVSGARTALGVGYTVTTSATQQIYYFDNGMVLQHVTVTPSAIAASSSAAHTWTYPVAFAQPPYVNVRAVSGNSAAFLATFETESNTVASGYLVNNSGSSVSPVLHYFAFGVKA